MNHRPLIAVVVGLLVASCSPSDHTKPIASAAPEVTADTTAPWPCHVITPGATTGLFRGADGIDVLGPEVMLDVDGDGDLDAVDSEQVDQQGVIWFENPGAP